jgi:hypothetical protein
VKYQLLDFSLMAFNLNFHLLLGGKKLFKAVNSGFVSLIIKTPWGIHIHLAIPPKQAE